MRYRAIAPDGAFCYRGPTMARVLLISCNLTQEPYCVYPLGMSLVAEAARRAGHDVREWDALAQAVDGEAGLPPVDLIEKFQPQVIGLSLRNIDNIDSSRSVSYTERYRLMVESLRRVSAAPIVLGGAGYSLYPEVLLDALGADYGVAGEGEKAFCKLVARIVAGNPPRERVTRGGVSPDGGDGCFARNGDLTGFYLREGGMLNVQAKRGCPFRCIYCTYPLLEGREYRFRPVGDIVDEIEILRDKYGARYFSFTDSVFNDCEGRYLEIAEEMVRRETRVPWMAFFRPTRFRAEEAALLKRSGLSAIEWGSDCSTDATLRAMGKDFTWPEVEESTRVFAEAGVANGHFIIFGGPGETPETVREGLANIERLAPCVVFGFRGVRVFPRAAIHRLAIDEGLVARDDDLLKPVFYFSPQIDPDFLHRSLLEAFASRIDRVYPPGDGLEKVLAFHRLGNRGPIWDLLLGGGGGGRRRKRS